MSILVYPSGVPIESGNLSVSADSFSVCQLTSSKFFMVYRQYNPNYVFGRVVEVNESTKTINYGDQWVINIINPTYPYLAVRRVDNNKAVLFVNNSFKLEGMTVEVSGLIPVFSSSYTLLSAEEGNTLNSTEMFQIVEMGVSSFFVLTRGSNNYFGHKVVVSGNSFNLVRIPSILDSNSLPLLMPHKVPSSSESIPYTSFPATPSNTLGFSHTISKINLHRFYIATSSVNVSATRTNFPSVFVSAHNYGNTSTNVSSLEFRIDISNDGSLGAAFFGDKIIIFNMNANAATGVSHNYVYTNTTSEYLMDISFIRNDEILAVTNTKAHVFKMIGSFPNYAIIKSSAHTFYSDPPGTVQRNFTGPHTGNSSLFKRLFRIDENMYIYFFRESATDNVRMPIRATLIYAP
ncbi:MAG: hypothetical protein QXF12_03155 [Candidatus Aenigmatarchaeota archaeon]